MHPGTYPFLFENGEFYLQFGLPSTRIQWKQSPKTHLFKNTLQSRVFENAGFSFTCGQTKMEVFKYVDVIQHIYTSSMTHAPKGMVSYFHRFSFFSCVDRRKWFEYATCGCIFFEKGGYPDACGWGHNRCIDHCKIFQDLVSQDTTLFPQYKFTLFAITHTSIPFSKPAVNPRMYFLIHGVK